MCHVGKFEGVKMVNLKGSDIKDKIIKQTHIK